MKKLKEENKLVIYQAKNGAIEFKSDIKKETIWASQAQIAQLFDVTTQNVTLHLNNIFKDKELDIGSTCKEFLQVQIEGNRKVERNIKFYNLDAIIAIGYRINSVTGTNFRIWSTKVLKQHLIKGYSINRKIISKNYTEFIKDVDNIKNLLPKNLESSQNVLQLIKAFADTWLSLDSYDKDEVKIIKASKDYDSSS